MCEAFPVEGSPEVTFHVHTWPEVLRPERKRIEDTEGVIVVFVHTTERSEGFRSMEVLYKDVPSALVKPQDGREQRVSPFEVG